MKSSKLNRILYKNYINLVLGTHFFQIVSFKKNYKNMIKRYHYFKLTLTSEHYSFVEKLKIVEKQLCKLN